MIFGCVYIFLLPHQTTTIFALSQPKPRCVISYFYIKPQLTPTATPLPPPPFPTRPKQKRRRTPHAGQKQPRNHGQVTTDYQYNRAPQNFPISVEKLSYKRIFYDHRRKFFRSPMTICDHLRKFEHPPKLLFHYYGRAQMLIKRFVRPSQIVHKNYLLRQTRGLFSLS